MKRLFIVLLGIISISSPIFILKSCTGAHSKNADTPAYVEIEKDHVLINAVLSKEEQSQLTPTKVLDILKEGNEEFVNDNLTVRNNSQRVRNAALGQYPKAVVLSCLDSRVPVEDVFHRGIGDIFVARVAGNVVNEDILASLEYACKVSGSKLIVVLGHEYCGAVKSAIDDVKLGNITSLLKKMKPAVEKAKIGFTGDVSSKNPEFVESVCDQNVYLAIDEIRAKSPILKDMEDNGDIMIIGGVYDMETGRVSFYNK